ncbi:MAG: peptidoglycan-binding domain-containing protein [Micropruina sp.]|uniref:peptidoglycan-binding domain-containing protein n=1 Tax=Micropruina sp. TaxID=2737536 RepID=UPI0039E63A72
MISARDAVRALTGLLAGAEQNVETASGFTGAIAEAVKAFQKVAGRPVTGKLDDRTWAALFMTLDAPTPKVTGRAQVGQKLTAAAGSWGPGSVGLAYQWYRGETAVAGATKATYRLTSKDKGMAISVAVRGSKAGLHGGREEGHGLRRHMTPAPGVTTRRRR